MSKDTEVTPILIKDKDKVYRILNIIFAKDNSIYFSFPSSRKRIISSFDEKSYDNKIYSEQIRTFKEFKLESLEPKVSFHPPNSRYPDSYVVHINSNQIGAIVNNREVLNIGNEGEIFIYFMQIIVPKDLSFFDEYNNKKYSKYIEIDNEKLNGEMLSLEIIIHSKGINKADYYLPFSKNRIQHIATTINTSNDITCTIVISTLKDSKNDDNSDLILSINTKETHGLYKIVNI